MLVMLLLFATFHSHDFTFFIYFLYFIKKFEAAYMKCIKMFFGYDGDRRHSVTMMLMDLRLPILCLRFYIMHHSTFMRECLTMLIL